MGGHAVGHIVAEGVEINGALFENIPVLILHDDMDVVFLKEPLGVVGVSAPHLHI